MGNIVGIGKDVFLIRIIPLQCYFYGNAVFFALCDDLFELRDRERAGGDIRLKPEPRRRITVKRPPGPPGPPRP